MVDGKATGFSIHDLIISEALCRWVLSQSDPGSDRLKYHEFLGLKKLCVCVFFSLCCQPCVRLRAACVGGLATMEVLTLQFGRVMSTEACNEYKRAYIVYRSSMNSLAIYALERKECRYHLRPKQHQLGHVCNHVLPKNPRYLANFLSEDFIYKSKVLAEKCHALFMSKQVLQRYAIGACLRWRDP